MADNPFGTSTNPFAPHSKTSQYAANVAKLKKKKTHHSLLGNVAGGVASVVGNAVDEAKDMAVGSATGLVDLAEHPTHIEDLGHAIVTDYKTRYGKIFSGDFSDLKKHPLSYILDAASVASLGAGSLAKVGLLSREGKLAEIGFTKGTGGVKVNLSHDPLKRGRQRAVLALQKTVIPEKTPVVGIRARATRTVAHEQANFEAHLRTSARQYARLTKGFKPHEAVALDSVIRGIAPRQELAMLRRLHGTGAPAEAVHRLADPKAQKLFDDTVAVRKGRTPATPETQKIIDAYEGHAQVARENTDMLVVAGKLDPDTTKGRAVLHHLVMRKALGLPGMASAEHIAEQVERDTGFAPVYTPDSVHFATSSKGSAKSHGSVFKAGMRAPAAAHIIDRHEVASRIIGAQAAKDRLMTAAKTFTAATDKPKDWVWLADNVTSKDWLKDNLPNFEQEGKLLRTSGDTGEVLRSSLTQNAMPSHGMAVPETAVQDLIKQRQRMVGTVGDMLSVGTDLWKKIILGLRPAFLTGNLSGNQILYHLHNGLGPQGMKALASARRESGTLERHFAEHGKDFTLGATEMLKDKGRINKGMNVLFHGVSTHEAILRSATMQRAARKIPAFKSIEKRIAHDVRSGRLHLKKGESIFGKAMAEALDKHDWMRGEIGSVIDDTMGNYRYYNRFERGLKQLVPFYGWNRHAMRSYTRMIEDHPALADAIAHLGAYGNEHNSIDFPGTPEFMQSYAHAGFLKKLGLGDTLDTRSLNPLAAAADTTRAVDQLVHMKPGHLDAVSSNINPLITALAQTATNTNLTTGAPLPHTAFEKLPLGGILGQLINGLPQVKLGEHLAGMDKPDGPQYTPTGRPKKPTEHMLTRGTGDMLAGILGVPSRGVDLKVAQELQKRLDATSGGYHLAKKRKSKKRYTTPA